MRLRAVVPTRDLPDLDELFQVVTECDGHPPIGEHKYLDLLHPTPERVAGFVAEGPGGPVGYVAVSPTQEEGVWAVELALHPLHRSRGSMRALVERAVDEVSACGGKRIRLWAFQPNLVEVLEEAGFRPERELRQLRRPLPVGEHPRFPDGIEVRPFQPGIDDTAWLRVNNAAFAGHPENGAWTPEVLEDRKAQEWFDPDGFRMAWEGRDLVGFCWTKVHRRAEPRERTPSSDAGEIYVVGVAPEQQGRGLGRALVLEGLRHLWEERGTPSAMLYVESDNAPALRLYSRLGFRLDHVDRSLVRQL